MAHRIFKSGVAVTGVDVSVEGIQRVKANCPE